MNEAYVTPGAVQIEHVAWFLTVYNDAGTIVVARVGRLTESPHEVIVALVAHSDRMPGITTLTQNPDGGASTYTALRPFTPTEAMRLSRAIERVTNGGMA